MTHASEDFLIDFEIDSVWSKCIYRERCHASAAQPQCSRNNSSTVHGLYHAPAGKVEIEFNPNPHAEKHLASTLVRDVNGISLLLCVRKHNYKKYLWQFVHEGVFNGARAYENLDLWTVQLKVRMHRKVPFGCLMRGLQSRLGLRSSESLKFCLDGFYGMLGCGDIFGNHGIDDVPWMEVSTQSTALSLRLQENDILFVSYSNEKLESLARERKRNYLAGAQRSSARQLVSASGVLVSGGHNLQLASASRRQEAPPQRKSRSATPKVGVAQPPSMHQALMIPPLRIHSGVVETHSGQPLCLATESAAPDTQFCLAVINPNDSDFDRDRMELCALFTVDAAELVPGALDRLFRLQSELGDLFRVPHPACACGLALAMSPDLLTSLLNAACPTVPSEASDCQPCPASILLSLQGEAKSRVFRFDAALLDDAEAGCAFSEGVGVVDELRRFATELEARLSVQCGSPERLSGTTWRVAGVNDFVVETFFASALASMYGTEREHRFQPYTVDAALRSIDEGFAYCDLYPTAPRDHHLARAWELLYSLHPTTRELAALEPCQFVTRLKHKFLQANETWQNFVGYSISFLFEDYNAKKAAFWAINYLVSHRSVYDTLLAEIEDATSKATVGFSEFGRLTIRNIEGMQHLEAFVKEVFRLTSGQFIRFQANTSFLLQTKASLGFKYKKGSQIGVLLRALNMNPRFFRSPEAFSPQRFLPDSQEAAQLCLPFGSVSPRRRIGLLKLKLFLVQLLSRCRLGRRGPSAEINSRMYGTDVLPGVEDVNFQFKPRQLAGVQ